MKKVRDLILITILFLLNISLLTAKSDFEKGIAYLLLKDPSSARPFFSNYFNDNYNPIVKSGYSFLLKGEMNEAKKEFNRYLNMNFRSTEALIGISISVSGLKESTSVENLNKVIKLNRGNSAAYACLGIEFQNIENYPEAERNFRLAMKYLPIFEYRILLGNLYLETGKPGAVLSLIGSFAENNPENFQLNFIAARALYEMNRIGEMKKYVNRSLELMGSNDDVKFLYAKFLFKTGKFKQSRSILKSLRTKIGFDKEILKLYAKALMKIGDRKAKDALYQLFSRYPWDNEVNLLMGEYYFRNKNEKSNIQNWINRAILSGSGIKEIKSIFGESFNYPIVNKFLFFNIRKLEWIDDSTFLICAKKYSGDPERIYIADINKRRISGSFSYYGKFLSSHLSKDKNKILIASKVTSGINVYGFQKKGSNWSYRKLNNRVLPIESADFGFNSDASLAYIVDGSIESLSFTSPFSRVNRFGEKSAVFPNFGFRVYRYNFVKARLTLMDDIEEIEKIPVRSIKRYFMILNANNTTGQVSRLIEKGEKLDVISTDLVKIIFSKTNDAFIIFLADLKNAFQSVIFHNKTGEIINVDATMFLDKGRFAEINILEFDSLRKRIIFTTRDKRKDLIVFNYKSKLYRKIAEHYYSGRIDDKNKNMYILSERDKKFSLTETIFTLASLGKGWISEISNRRDISKIEDCTDILNVIVHTNRGEMLVMDHNNKFSYLSPSYSGSLHSISPDKKHVAIYTNGFLFYFNNYRQWEKREVLKK